MAEHSDTAPNLKVRLTIKYKNMKVLNHLLHPVKKFSKGMFALLTLNLLVVLCVFLFDSCKKAAYERSDTNQANTKFMAALEANKKSIASISFISRSKTQKGTAARIAPDGDDYLTTYLQYPEDGTSEPTPVQEINSIEELAHVIQSDDAILQYEPTATNEMYPIDIPIESVTTSLQPLISEAKQYLYSKGFTDNDIQSMIIENEGSEEDLVPLVMSLTNIENNQQNVAHSFPNLFMNSAYAKEITWSEVGQCAMVAIGADILYALQGSTASSWTIPAMKKAFGAVAKRMLGPIGVAVAVVSFGLCLYQAY